MPRNPNPKPDTEAAAANNSLSYEQALGELERLVQAMESAQMPLDQMLASYQRGSQLLQLCHGRLRAVEAQVKLLDDGQLKPWAES
jgi:exodeoxyribonuclease VII small subunit